MLRLRAHGEALKRLSFEGLIMESSAFVVVSYASASGPFAELCRTPVVTRTRTRTRTLTLTLTRILTLTRTLTRTQTLTLTRTLTLGHARSQPALAAPGGRAARRRAAPRLPPAAG